MNSFEESKEDILDLSLKDFFVIVHYKECDPGNEFDILHQNQIIDDNSWDTLQRGVEVTVKFGSARVQALIVQVSDDYQYLQKNFKSITEEFLEDTKDGIYKCEVVTNTLIDKSTQTDPQYEPVGNYQVLQSKYNNLLKLYEGLANNLRAALHKSDVLLEAGNHRENFETENAKRKQVLTQVNGNQNKNKDVEANGEEDETMVYIGTHKTPVPKDMYHSVNWLSYSAATRKLLIAVFPRKILATHSLTGKPSPAFIGVDKTTKMRLDPIKISDIVEVVSKKCHVSESIVRSAITTKCADENKMYRKRLAKKHSEENDENDEKRFKIGLSKQ